MKVLVLGSTGFVGKNLVKKLINTNYNVKLTSRKKNNNEIKNTEIIEMDLLDPDLNFKKLIDNCDTIINTNYMVIFAVQNVLLHTILTIFQKKIMFGNTIHY